MEKYFNTEREFQSKLNLLWKFNIQFKLGFDMEGSLLKSRRDKKHYSYHLSLPNVPI